MKLKQLIRVLEKKNNTDVEFIICTPSGEIVAMNVELSAVDMQKVLAVFGKKKTTDKEHSS